MSEKSEIIFPEILTFLEKAQAQIISPERQKVLLPLIEYIQQKTSAKQEINLNFICTHNSRRSQFAQIWAQVASTFYGIDLNSFSGGVEITAFNLRAIESLIRAGFRITSESIESENPTFRVHYSERKNSLKMFSKLFDDAANKAEAFAAVMTCSHADENCPFIPGTEKRIALNYSDPKEYDGTSIESEKYDERSLQIASEMMYVFSKISQ